MTDIPRPAPGDTDWIDWADDEEATSDAFRDGVSVTELSATGTKDATTFLRGDNTWAAPPAGTGTDTAVALGILYAGLATRTVTPCRIVFEGSSTTAGLNATSTANQFVSRLVAMIQGAYPSGLGTETTVVASTTNSFGTLSTATGVHGYNGAESGTTSANYLTSGEITAVAALNPRAVFHMIGSNDYQAGVAVATYKANVQAAITSLKAQTTGPCVHVLVQSYERFDGGFTPVATWAAYGAALKQIADADPNNVMYIDLDALYRTVGVPSTDPLDVIDTDNLHQNDAGHALMAYLLAKALGIPAGTSTSAATSPTSLSRVQSDSLMAASGDPNTRVSDLALGGGKALVWSGLPTGNYALSSTGMVRATSGAACFVGVPETVANAQVAVTVDALPTADILYLDLHRVAVDPTTTPNGYRVTITTAGVAQIAKRVSGTLTGLGPTVTIGAGDRIALRYYNGTLTMYRNGIAAASVSDATVPAKGFAGIAGGTGTTGFRVSNFTYDAVI